MTAKALTKPDGPIRSDKKCSSRFPQVLNGQTYGQAYIPNYKVGLQPKTHALKRLK